MSEPYSVVVAGWYAREKNELVLVYPRIRQRTRRQAANRRDRCPTAQNAWARFERMVAADLRLFLVEPVNFHRAAELVLDPESALRAGDALHLTCGKTAGAKHMATLDDVLGRNAQRLKIKLVALRRPR